MNKIISIIAVLFIFAVSSYGQPSLPDEANALFDKGDYIKGMNILTKAMNSPSPQERAGAMLAYARFYENIVGNMNSALMFYDNIIRTPLAANDPAKISAQKAIGKIKSLASEYAAQDSLLKKIRPSELMSRSELQDQILQLNSIVLQKPNYYRLSEVYYYLGREYLALENYHAAWLSLKKSLELKPGVNFYLPVNVWADAAYGKWIRSIISSTVWGIMGGLLILTAIAFYASCPWRWLRLRHILIGSLLVILWLIVFSIAYIWLTNRLNVPLKTMLDAGVVMPYFLSFGPDSPDWFITKTLFMYGSIGVLGSFVFSIAMSRLKWLWVTIPSNLIFAVLLFSSLIAVFYLRNCDQKSMFNSEATSGIRHYLDGNNYFVNFNMEPYILTNPRAYPDLAAENIADLHLREWILRYCPFTPPANKAASEKK